MRAPKSILPLLLLAGGRDPITFDFNREPRPDNLSGTWELTMVADPHLGGLEDVQGACEFDPVVVRFTPLDPDTSFVQSHRGHHSGGRIECKGFNEAAVEWTGLGDTTMVFPPDTLSAWIRPRCLGCGSQDRVSIYLWGFIPMDEVVVDGGTYMDGDLWIYPLADSISHLEGRWIGQRVSER